MLAPNTILQGRYLIIRQLAQGGMGTIYEAIDQRLDATVALKETFFTEEALRRQFEREARLLARLHHPALPRVSDHFTEGDGQFLVMQFIAGEDLSEMLKRKGGPFPPDTVLKWGDNLLDALDYLHTQEPPVIHRDIKPQNLKLTARGQIILLDFGLAKGFAGQISRVTTSGSIFGYTPNYAPLEQIQGTGTDPRSDLYSLAATVYHLMTGAAPLDVLTRLTATTDGQPDPLRLANEVNPQVPPDVAAILHKAMAIGRNQRPNSAAEMRRMLNEASQSVSSGSSKAKAEALPPTQYVREAPPSLSTVSSPTPIQRPQEQIPAAASSSTAPPRSSSKQTYKTAPLQSYETQAPAGSFIPWRIVIPALVVLIVCFGAFSALRRNRMRVARNRQTAQYSQPSPSNPTPSTQSTPEQQKTSTPERGAEETPKSAPTSPPSKKTVSGGVLNGKAISKPAPPYPPVARAARAQGAVTVQVVVDEDGRVISANAVSGHPLLHQAAVAAARQARFSPTLLGGQPVKVSGVITYNFVLQ